MDTPIRRLFNRRKSTARINEPGNAFQQTASYGAISPGAAPQIGAYPIKPSETQNELYSHSKKSSNAQSLNGAKDGSNNRRSRAKSTSGISMDGIASIGDTSRRTSIGTRGTETSELPIVVPPVPKIPQSVSQTKSLGRNSFKYVDILQAVGAQDESRSRPSSSDPYSMTVADRNVRKSRLPDGTDDPSLRSSSIRSSTIDRQGTAEYHSFLSENHENTNEESQDAREGSVKSRTKSFTSTKKKKQNVHSSAQWFEPPQKSQSSGNNRNPISSQKHSQSGSSTMKAPKENGVPQNRAERLGRMHAKANIFDTERSLGLKHTEPPTKPVDPPQVPAEPRSVGSPRTNGNHPPSAYQATAPRLVNDGTTEAIEAIRNRYRTQMSVTSEGSIPSPLMSGSRHRSAPSGDLGSDMSDLSELDSEVGQPMVAKPDPIQSIRASIVGASQYKYSSEEPDLSRSPSRRPRLSRDNSAQSIGDRISETVDVSRRPQISRENSAQSIKDRSSEPVQNMQSNKLHQEIETPAKRPYSPRKSPEHAPEFDLRAEFQRLELENEAAKGNHVIYSPIDREDWQQRTQSLTSLRNRQDYNETSIIARDFAPQPPKLPGVNGDGSDSEDEATPPSFSRERAMTMDRSPRNPNRRSLISNYLRKASQSRERTKTNSKSNIRTSSMTRPTSSHTLKATIERPDDVSDSNNGYSRTSSMTTNGFNSNPPKDPIEAIQEKRKRSLTLEAMARAPLNLEPLPTIPSSTTYQPPVPRFAQPDERHSSLKSRPVQPIPPVPTPTSPLHSPTFKSPRLPSPDSPPPAFSATGARLINNNKIRPLHSSQPLRQYQHHNNQPSGTSWTTNEAEAEADDDDEDFVSARSSIRSASTSTPSTPPPTTAPLSPKVANPTSQPISPPRQSRRSGSGSGRARFSYLFNGSSSGGGGGPHSPDEDPDLVNRYYDNARPTTSSSTYSTESTRSNKRSSIVDVPPRRSSLYGGQHRSQRSKGGGDRDDYFGDAVSPDASGIGNRNGGGDGDMTPTASASARGGRLDE